MKRLLFFPLLAAMIAVHAQNIKEGETLQEVTVKGSKIVQRVDGQIRQYADTQSHVASFVWS